MKFSRLISNFRQRVSTEASRAAVAINKQLRVVQIAPQSAAAATARVG